MNPSKYLETLIKFIYEQKFNIINFFNITVQRLNNIEDTNYQLGLRHLNNGNEWDARFRFLLLQYFFGKKEQYTYNLGRCYVYANKINKAISCFSSINSQKSSYRVNILKKEKIDNIPQGVIEEDFNFYARLYEEAVFSRNYQAPKFLLELFENYLASSKEELEFKSVIDIGCGTGLVGYFYQKTKLKFDYFAGVDIASEILDQAELNNLAEQSVIYNDLINSDYKEFLRKHNTRYNIIIAANSLHYQKDLSKEISFLMNYVEKNGYLIFSVDSDNKNDHHFNYKFNNFVFNKEQLNKISNKIVALDILSYQKDQSGLFCIIKNN